MPYVIGFMLALSVALFGRRSGFDRDRAFYSTITIVVAALYVLFATMTGSVGIVLKEVVLMSAFVSAAIVGFRSNLWIVAAALTGHGLLDMVHGLVLDNPGVPVWWPAFCATYDVVAGALMAWMLKNGSLSAAPKENADATR